MKKDQLPPRIHDIVKLTALCNDLNIHIPLSLDEQVLLSSVYIDTRYPPDLGLLPGGEPTKEDTEIIVGIIKKLKQWVEDQEK